MLKPKVLLFLSFFYFPFAASAGGGVHGANIISKLLSDAQMIEIPKIIKSVKPSDLKDAKPRVSTFYQKVRVLLIDDLKSLKLKMTQDRLKDTYKGYETWIAINVNDGIIYYNPEKFEALTKSTPELKIVVKYLLHEMGHYYNLNEDDAWEFSNTLMSTQPEFARSETEELCTAIPGASYGTFTIDDAHYFPENYWAPGRDHLGRKVTVVAGYAQNGDVGTFGCVVVGSGIDADTIRKSGFCKINRSWKKSGLKQFKCGDNSTYSSWGFYEYRNATEVFNNSCAESEDKWNKNIKSGFAVRDLSFRDSPWYGIGAEGVMDKKCNP